MDLYFKYQMYPGEKSRSNRFKYVVSDIRRGLIELKGTVGPRRRYYYVLLTATLVHMWSQVSTGEQIR